MTNPTDFVYYYHAKNTLYKVSTDDIETLLGTYEYEPIEHKFLSSHLDYMQPLLNYVSGNTNEI